MKEWFMRSFLVFVFAALPAWAAETVPPEVISYPDTIVHNGKLWQLEMERFCCRARISRFFPFAVRKQG